MARPHDSVKQTKQQDGAFSDALTATGNSCPGLVNAACAVGYQAATQHGTRCVLVQVLCTQGSSATVTTAVAELVILLLP